jgi:hypothetical protein
MLTTTTDGFVLSWDIDIANPVMALDSGRRMKFTGIAITAGGKYVAVGCEDYCVR